MYIPIRRYGLVLISVLAGLVLPACNSSQPTAVPTTTIGILSSAANLSPVIDGFKAGMGDLGYVEGKTVTYLYDGPMKNDSQVIDVEIQTLKSKGATLFLVIGTLPSQRLSLALKGTNMAGVFAPLLSPVELGIADSLQKPGGRMTGIATGGPLLEKSLEWLLAAVPGAKRIAVPYLHNDANATTQLPVLKTDTAKLNVQLVTQELTSADQAITALSALSKGTDAILLIPALFSDPFPLSKYVKAATALGLPVGTSYSAGSDAGALVSISTDPPKMGKQAARLLQQIIQGGDPGTVPIELAEFTYNINLATADALGLPISDTTLRQANKIVRGVGNGMPTVESF